MGDFTYYISEAAKIGKDCEIEHGAIIEDDVVIGDNCKISYYAIIQSGTKIGNGCYIGPFVVIRKDVQIGNFTEIRPHAFIAEGVKIGSNVRIFQLANISGWAEIEDCVYIGPNVIMSNSLRIAHLRKDPSIAPLKIKYGARVASGAIVLPGVTIGEQSLIGAGAIVAKNVPSREIHFGFPAVKRGSISKEELIDKKRIK